jgi:hydrogenase maturation protease
MSILVAGFGNALAGDDAAGPLVLSRLAASPLPAGVRLVEGGTDALRLRSLWQGEDEVWLVDAVAKGSPPGTLHRLGHGAVLALPQRSDHAHALSLPECLRWLALTFPELARVRYRLWGIEPSQVEPRWGASPAVTRAAEAVAGEILAELRARTLLESRKRRAPPRPEHAHALRTPRRHRGRAGAHRRLR